MRKSFLALVLILWIACKKESSNTTELPNTYSNQSVGASANHLLSSAGATALKVEIQYMSGYTPDARAVSHFEGLLNSILNKPAGISIVQTEITAQHKGTY